MRLPFFGDRNENQGIVEAEIWRAVDRNEGYNQWGDYDDDVPEPPIPTLYGREMVDKGLAVMEPRVTRIDTRSGQIDGTTVTGITLFFRDWNVDLQPGDMVAFVDHKGVYEAWKLEGEGGTNNYVSPFTGIVGGREVFLVRNREIR